MAGLGIYDYGARFYSPKLDRFLSADTIVPGVANPQAMNRYSYVLGNPIRYNDPTGHMCSDPDDPTPSCDGSGTPPPTTPLPNPGSSGNPPTPGGNDNDDLADDLADELASNGGGGGKPLYSLDNYSCVHDPNCFLATQEEIIFMSNFLTGMAVAQFVTSVVALAVSGSILVSAALSGGIFLPLVPDAIVLGLLGIEQGVEVYDSISTSEYLKSLAQNTPVGTTIEIHKQESLFETGYYTEGDNATQGTFMPETRMLMWLFASTASRDD